MSNLYAFEKEIVDAAEMGLDVSEEKFESDLKGLCIDNFIFINKNLSFTEKNCIVAEEIGHALLNSGDITDQTDIINRKQERRGRAYAYMRLMPLNKIISAVVNCGCSTTKEVAEQLEVTEEFFIEAIHYYRQQYGQFFIFDEFVLSLSENGVYIQKKSDVEKIM